MYVYLVVGIVKLQFDLVINSLEVEIVFDVFLEFFFFKVIYRCEKMIFKSKIFDIYLFDFEMSDDKY